MMLYQKHFKKCLSIEIHKPDIQLKRVPLVAPRKSLDIVVYQSLCELVFQCHALLSPIAKISCLVAGLPQTRC